MTKHKSFTVATKVNVYFYDPQSPRQCGTNENTNGLLRQYFRKKFDLSVYAQSELDKVAMCLNQRPGKWGIARHAAVPHSVPYAPHNPAPLSSKSGGPFH
jgi:hypothetical protein